MKRKLDARHTLIKRVHFPFAASSKGGKRVMLGLGGNVGDVIRRFEHLFWHFRRSSFVRVLESSPVVKNPPFGYLEQDDFYNSVMLVETKLAPKALLRYLLRIEKRFGRKRLFKDGPRTLDIDILFYEDVIIETKQLQLPHPKWQERDSVLIPLSYMKKAI